MPLLHSVLYPNESHIFFSKWTCALQHLLLISLYIEGHKDKREYNCKLSKVLEKVVVVHIVKRYLTK